MLCTAHGVRAASSTAHPTPEHPRLPRSPSGRTGPHPAGTPFLWLLSFGEAKESDSPAGAKSRLREEDPQQGVMTSAR
ncbi:hypothetical protein C8232_09025 [Paracidovorax avenae]|nr:hypothetical protein C8232_09025 [Paracidovorax avenae]